MLFYYSFLGVFIVDSTFVPACSFLCCFFVRYFVFLVLYPCCYRLETALFYPQAFFTLHSFPTFSVTTTTTCFYRDFPESWQFFLEGCRVAHCNSKYIPDPSVYLDHTVFSKGYYSIGSTLCVTLWREVLYTTLAGFEPTL